MNLAIDTDLDASLSKYAEKINQTKKGTCHSSSIYAKFWKIQANL